MTLIGILTLIPIPACKPIPDETAPTTSAVQTPQTGDDAPILLLSILCLGIFVALFILIAKGKSILLHVLITS